MKKIAITQRLIANSSYHETREALDIQYSKLIHAAGFLPIILPYEVDFKEYFSECTIDGILLTGGNDLNSVNEDSLSKQRDEYEKALIKFAVENSIPLFGICRGLQVIAEYFGSDFKKTTGHVAVRHNLNINEDSHYAKDLKALGAVNSFHNYAIDTLGKGLLPSATSPDGIIKAVEHIKYALFGQMWHTERESPFKKEEVAFIQKFFNGNYR
ncbi:type 1 glutamine amidotransferase [Sulfuricurvum sp.]|uniref:type 1 glutamine amidotransferase n=1 Tax=Sulfuricurvum sp. TaxID=2025608 RepID=UPI0025DFFD67|nr:type 1 glutamine amidotransferase [Sulfuricurvum sp.]